MQTSFLVGSLAAILALYVVIAILAVLASLLLPALASAQTIPLSTFERVRKSS